MGPFEEFVESDLFFPVLFGIVILLIIAFVIFMMIDKNREKKYISELRKEHEESDLQLREDDSINQSVTQTIQIPIKKVVKQVVVQKNEEPINETKEEIKEESNNSSIDSKELDLSHTVAPTVVNEFKPKPKLVAKVEERTEIAEDAPVVDLKIADTSTDESLEATKVLQISEEVDSNDEIIVPDSVKVVDEEEGEEVVAPTAAVQLNEDVGEKVVEEKIVKEPKVVEEKKTNAFSTKPNGNMDINEDIKYDPPKEYVGVKTEILDISDLSNKEE